MMTTARPDFDSEIEFRPAICKRHPEDSEEMWFCYDCSRVFCAYCQRADDIRTSHREHNTIRLKELLTVRKERIAQLREQLCEFTIKHDADLDDASKLVLEKNRQIQALKDLIDQFAQKLHQKVEELKETAQRFIQNKVLQMWETSPATTLQKAADETLSNILEVRDSLVSEISRAERDQLTMAERSDEMDALGDQLDSFLQSQVQQPNASSFDLVELRAQMQASIAQLENEMSRSREAFVRRIDYCVFPSPDKVQLVEHQTLKAQSLVLPTDENKTPNINGVAYEENTNIIYFTDLSNCSSIRSLNMKTRQISEVFSAPSDVRLYGLFVASDSPNRPFIVTTEHTTTTPTSVRVNFLRRKSSGQLALVQSVTLQESKNYSSSSFASGPNGSVFCAFHYSTSIHELCRSPANSGSPFADDSKLHSLAANVHYICGLQCVGEHRLVASFADRSVRVFRVAGGALSEVQRITEPADDWTPHTLVGLPDGGICICSRFQDPEDSHTKCGIDLCALDSSGTLSTPRRLVQFPNRVAVWCHQRAPNSSDSAHGIVVAEYSNRTTVLTLRVFLFEQN